MSRSIEELVPRPRDDASIPTPYDEYAVDGCTNSWHFAVDGLGKPATCPACGSAEMATAMLWCGWCGWRYSDGRCTNSEHETIRLTKMARGTR